MLSNNLPRWFSQFGGVFFHDVQSFTRRLHTALTGSAAWRTLRTKPPQNELAFANNPLAERPRGRPGNVIPLHVLDVAAAVANEMVMPHALQIESPGAALDGHFPYQAGLHQVP